MTEQSTDNLVATLNAVNSVEPSPAQIRDALALAEVCVATMRAWERVLDDDLYPPDVMLRAEMATERRRDMVEAYALRWC